MVTPVPVMPSETEVIESPATIQASGQWYDGWYQGASGYDRAAEEYERTNKPMMVYINVKWCPYCRKFERGVLSLPEVKDFLKDKIKVMVNPDVGPQEERIAQRYGVRGFPSVFLHPPRPAGAVQLYTGVTSAEFIESFQQFLD